MRIHLDSTEQFLQVNGVMGRVWVGHTDKKGTPIQCLVMLVRARSQDDNSELEAELHECLVDRWPKPPDAQL